MAKYDILDITGQSGTVPGLILDQFDENGAATEIEDDVVSARVLVLGTGSNSERNIVRAGGDASGMSFEFAELSEESSGIIRVAPQIFVPEFQLPENGDQGSSFAEGVWWRVGNDITVKMACVVDADINFGSEGFWGLTVGNGPPEPTFPSGLNLLSMGFGAGSAYAFDSTDVLFVGACNWSFFSDSFQAVFSAKDGDPTGGGLTDARPFDWNDGGYMFLDIVYSVVDEEDE